jgi:alpha-N-acetylglucosaminidase
MMKRYITLVLISLFSSAVFANPIADMLERIDPGASKKFAIEVAKDGNKDYFELSQKGKRVLIRGNNYVSISVGINWYLKYYAGIHLSWNGMTAKLPEVLPAIPKKERHSTDLKLRYDFNYCTFSYSMAFWDWDRWQKEIDWMALHGINLPLNVIGEECIWNNMLKKLGYNKDDIGSFIAGPAFLAWWEMNNLEGWGGPNPDSWYKQQEALQKKILLRMKEFGIEPVFPGYSGMMPHNAKEKLGLEVADAKLWNGYKRPTFLLPTDSRFEEIASLYYKEQEALFGKANYYSMDPFHEAEGMDKIDFDAAGKAIMQAMKKVNPKAVWVIQGWTENPREEVIQNLRQGDLLILDLFSECRPMWGMKPSLWYREKGYGKHNWLFCMLENFGAKVGIHGRMDQLLENFYETRTNPLAAQMKGIGLTMEGIENNPMMFELMTELPWREAQVTKESWLKEYLFARYGKKDETIEKAWGILANSILNCPRGNNQQGTLESILCARPSLNAFQTSSWAKLENYYDPVTTRDAAKLMLSVADKYRGNNNFEYDLVDIVRQSIADHAREVYNHTVADFKCFHREGFEKGSKKFLDLILLQDKLLGTRKEFRVGNWIQQARSLGNNDEEKNLYEWNARVQITTWGNRISADDGGLRDYAHKEWNGILKDFYYKRWDAYWKTLNDVFDRKPLVTLDYYAMEEPWTKATNPYSAEPEGDCVETAKAAYAEAFSKY